MLLSAFSACKGPFGALFLSRDASQKKEIGKMRKSAGDLPFGVTFCEILRVRESAGALPKIKTGPDLFLFSFPHPQA
jgi:hypothetical protein